MKRTDIKKILIIGSGPIVIGQAAEFDYAGTQACLALKEEGYEVILVNSNPATIMTDTTIADKVYMEPLTLEYVAKIIRYERPDAIVPGIGGQTGLNLAMQLEKKGILRECGVELLGTSSESIERAEDRELFKEMCESIGEPVIPSEITYNIEEARAAAERIGYPIVLRPAFTLGGTGGGFAENAAELEELAPNAFALSPVHQVLIEKSVKGYKEIEFEVMRDGDDNAIPICGMENVDPVGVHTGDSIVVAPILSLSDSDRDMLCDSALRIIRELKISGGCNVQFALDPCSSRYYLIEVNPRVSRSSALASKASGYPIARVTAKIAVGMTLAEIPVAGGTAAIAPSLDYIVAKFPRFPFDKFTTVPNTLGTQMKATGEVMGIGSTLEECFLKSVRSLEIGVCHLRLERFDSVGSTELLSYVSVFHDDNIYAIAELLRRGESIERLHKATMITELFLECIARIVDMEKKLAAAPNDLALLREAKSAYDWVLIDAPAGLGRGFQLATGFADEAIVVTLADPASQRDAARATELLLAKRDIPVRMAVNRVSPKLFAKMQSTVDDVMDLVGLPLLGLVPEDPSVVLAAAAGRLLIDFTEQGAARACRNLALRLEGRRVALMKLK